VTWHRPSPSSLGIAIGNLLLAATIVLGVFLGLPVRYWVVDGGALGIALLLLTSSLALARNAPWQVRVARVAAWVVLALGLLLTAALVVGAACVRGVSGELGVRGTAILLVALALEVPYLVVYPAATLRWLGREAKSA
jgi:hypothetical protein